MYNSDPPSNIHFNAWQQWAFRMEQRMQEQQDMIEQLQQELELLKQQAGKEQHAPTIHVDKIEYRFDQLKVDTLEGSLQIGLSTSNPEQLPMMIEDFMMHQQNENSAAAPHYAQQYANKPNPKLDYLQEKFPSIRGAQKEANTQSPEQPRQNKGNSSPQQAAKTTQEQTSRSELAKQQLIDACIQLLHNELNEQFVQYIRRQSSLLQIEINDEHLKLIVEDIERQLPARVHHYVYDQHIKLKQASTEQLLQQVLRLTRDDIESAIDQYIHQISRQQEGEQ